MVYPSPQDKCSRLMNITTVQSANHLSMGGTEILKSLITSGWSCDSKCILVRTYVPV